MGQDDHGSIVTIAAIVRGLVESPLKVNLESQSTSRSSSGRSDSVGSGVPSVIRDSVGSGEGSGCRSTAAVSSHSPAAVAGKNTAVFASEFDSEAWRFRMTENVDAQVTEPSTS